MKVANVFADAVRRVAALAPSVDSGAVKAGKALAVGLALLALPVIHAQGVDPMSRQSITGATEAARVATEAAAKARVQGQLSTYYACGLLRTAKADITGFSEKAGVERIRNAALETLAGAGKVAPATTSLGQTVEGVATVARTLAMTGLSSAAEAVVGGASNEEWAAGWRAELSNVTDTIAAQAAAARSARDAGSVEAAISDLDDAYADMQCAAPRI